MTFHATKIATPFYENSINTSDLTPIYGDFAALANAAFR
jgi:hypothetical protein